MDIWIVSTDEALAERVRQAVQNIGIECAESRISRLESIGTHAKELAGFGGLVLFVSCQLDANDYEFLRQVRSVADEAADLAVISTLESHETVLSAIRAGASDYLCSDANLDQELACFVNRLKSGKKKEYAPSRVITVVPAHSPRDASFVAANLAAVIAQRTGTCGTLDFHFRGGELADLLKLAPRHTACDLFSQKGTLDATVYEQALTPHESGIHLLAGPELFADLRMIRPQVCQQIVDIARRSHGFVVINTEDVQHAEQVRALGSSDDVVLAIRLDVVSLHRAKQHLEFMARNRVPRERIHFVALGSGHAGELPIAAVKKVLQCAKVHVVPDDPVVELRSVNIGNPAVLESPHTKIAQALSSIADLFLPKSLSPVVRPRHDRIVSLKLAATAALNTLSCLR